ncbi:IL15 protein, partial [Dyaphorophyia castanea]|nr:IL15 protein [Platysteira castanea]
MMCKVLIFGCIAAVILMTAAYGAPLLTELPPAQEELLRASIMDLEQLKNFKNDYSGFYTPNDKQECYRTTLECYLRELEVLKEEVGEEDRRHIINIKKNLDDFKAGSSSDPTCKRCESHKQKKFPEFHQELKSFLQRMLK